ncbi:hypothetical protein [uncultured Rhodoferax sp.]|uniref:toxin-antitoxin system YwqK family antitoxin n=1 Tax=uncultured Rhodoferax sp. TaxID=223188 RepID=UPI0025F66A31|nr:hypothetical protein [uncultured Rhodoferax sp.]
MHHYPTPLRLALGTALLVAATGALAVQDCELDGKSINTNNGNETAGKNGMVRCKDRDSGQIEREYELRNGDSVGLSRYFRNGKLVKEFTITANGPHEGLEREWAQNGQLVLEFTNVKGNARGLRRSWYEDGSPKAVEWLADNEREGASAQFTQGKQLASLRCGPKPLLAPHVNDAALCGFGGSPSIVATYGSNGKQRATQTLLAGVVQKYALLMDNGKPQEEMERQGNQRTERFYGDDGSKRREKVWNEAEKPAVLQRESEYHASGQLVRERLYGVSEVNGRKRNRLLSEARFFLNGQPQSKERYTLVGETEQVERQHFNDKGILVAEGRFAMDGRYGQERGLGVHRSYYENGKLSQEETFDDKGNVKRLRSWDENGKQTADDELFEDGSRKAYSR